MRTAIDRAVAALVHRDPGLLLLRIGLALMFIESAIDKALNYSIYVGDAAAAGVPFAQFAVLAALVVEVIGSLALVTRIATVPAFLLLAAYTIAVNVFYFDFWSMDGRDAVMARKEFLKNVAVASGILLALAWITCADRVNTGD